ncbi:hypothetical protein OOZ19_29420 [Saccharopolyspora sp. NFXS83]|uniref:hypothetical protein n=1 Tax=Saccharopolyspora sp. NFXS83 TaxID=2993560 RepID=UPI00224AA96E|nr:hypothetical protein [Saccharopolyspora sp. NFXS83]MCX2734385.1 hypothetical protein [Saccharopolyspora sp. NFXS83]
MSVHKNKRLLMTAIATATAVAGGALGVTTAFGSPAEPAQDAATGKTGKTGTLIVRNETASPQDVTVAQDDEEYGHSLLPGERFDFALQGHGAPVITAHGQEMQVSPDGSDCRITGTDVLQCMNP